MIWGVYDCRIRPAEKKLMLTRHHIIRKENSGKKVVPSLRYQEGKGTNRKEGEQPDQVKEVGPQGDLRGERGFHLRL